MVVGLWGKSSPHNSAGDLFGMVNSRDPFSKVVNITSKDHGDENVTNWIICQSRRAPYISSLKIHFPCGKPSFLGFEAQFPSPDYQIPPPDLPPSGLHLQFSPFRCTQAGIRTWAFGRWQVNGEASLYRYGFSRVLPQKKMMTTTHAYKVLWSY